MDRPAREQVLAEPPGRRLDWWFHTVILGKEIAPDDPHLPQHSADLATCWRAAERARQTVGYLTLTALDPGRRVKFSGTEHYLCELARGEFHDVVASAYGVSAAHAVCRMLLLHKLRGTG